MRTAAIFVLLLVAATVEAATSYRVERKSKTQETVQRVDRVVCDGARCRIDPDEGWSMIVPSDGGTITSLNHELKTYWTSEPGTTSRLLSLPFPGGKISSVKVESSRSGDPSSLQTIVTLSYKLRSSIMGEPVNATVVASAIYTTTAAFENVLPEHYFSIRTGFDEVDAALRRELDAIPGLMLRRVLTVTRRIDGGPPFTEIITSDVIDLEQSDASPELFQLPEGYREQPPVYGVPGSGGAGVIRPATRR